MELVFLIYGAAFLLLGTAILVQPRRGSHFALSQILWLLAAFALLHGTNEWLDMWKLIRGSHHSLDAAGLVFLLASFGFLFEFGRRLIIISNPHLSTLLRRFLNWPTYALLFLGLIVATFASGDPGKNLRVWGRYLLGFPSALLCGVGLFSYYRFESNRLGRLAIKPYFILGGITFLAYSVLGGLVVPAADYFPANQLNHDSFRAVVGMPVQIFRALCAVAATVAIANILRIFSWEAHQKLEEALENAQASAARFRDLVESTSDWVWEVNAQGIYTYVSPKIKEILGYTPEEVLGRTPFDLMPPDEAQRVKTTFDSIVAARSPCSRLENTNYHKTGRLVVLETSAAPVFDSAGVLVGYRGIDRDITKPKQAELELRRNEANLRQAAKVFENTNEGVMITDPNQRIQAVNKAFTTITGYSEAEAIGNTPKMLQSKRHSNEFYRGMWTALQGTGCWQGEIWNRRKDGATYPEWLNISEVRDDANNLVNYIAVFSDITSIKQAQETLEYSANHDALTRLPNRALFRDRLEQLLARARRHQHGVALLFIDLDRFKLVNDSLGHDVGDQLLQEVARRLVACLRAEDTVARLGGDEFVIIQNEIKRPDDAATLAMRLLETMNAPMSLQGHEIFVTLSVGISVYPRDGEDLGALTKKADVAMYRAKEMGRNGYQYYNDELANSGLHRLELEADLRWALERGELTLHYQPQVDVQTSAIVGAEALARWHHPRRGMVPPDQFIPLAEEIGLIDAIGVWALNTACAAAKEWHAAGLPALRVAVNVSGRQISHDHVAEKVAGALRAAGLDPGLLEIELTESVLMTNTERAMTTIDALKKLGVCLAIDDFGTGYSSLSYLKRFPFDKIKIDKSFIQGLPGDSDNAALTRAIIAMAHSLKRTVIAEGVETAEQLAFLREHGCDEIQGYLFSKPLPPAQFVELLRNPNFCYLKGSESSRPPV